ncbi:MAG: U32 family peptidase [Bacilli bacterium]|nr:U32 family peptidase [Bacilli bacterium]
MALIELLAPAGSKEKMMFAFLYGADAIYFAGERYSLRANAINFTREEMKETVEYAHSMGKKCYVTVNIVFHNEDTKDIEEYLLFLDSIKVDAILASDISVMDLYNKLGLHMELHVSTQASILNKEAALFYKGLGAKRLVLARESSREDIKQIKEATGLDLECFAHGAMCTSISGRCVMSNYATNRDSNRGGCVQICRWTFDYTKDNEKLTDKPFSMTPKDLNMISYIQDMMNIGVNSFKIEGRMRSIYYVSTVILIYRRIIDRILNNTLTDEYKEYALKVLNRVANRESSPQFYNKMPGFEEQYYLGRDEASNQDFLALVLDSKDGYIKVEERNTFRVGDKVEFFGPSIDTFEYTITEIYDKDMNKIDKAVHPKEELYIKIDKEIPKYSMMRVKI